MEINLEQILSDIKGATPHPKLKDLLDSLNDDTMNKWIGGQEPNPLSAQIFQTLREVDARLKAIDPNIKIEAENQIRNIISLQLFYLDLALTKGEIRPIIRFLVLNVYLKFPLSSFLEKVEVDQLAKDKIIKNSKKVIDSLISNINVPADAPYHEKQLLKDFIDGQAENNLEKAFRFVSAVEMGRGFHISYMYEALVSFLFELDRNSYGECLNARKKFNDIIVFLNIIERPGLVSFGLEKELQNKWTIFELIRQILRKEKQFAVEEDGLRCIQKQVHDLWKLDEAFSKSVMKHFYSSAGFNLALGAFLADSSFENQQKVIDSCFIMKTDGQNLLGKGNLLEKYQATADEGDLKLFLEYVFNKWDAYFISLAQDESYYAFKLILNDFSNFVTVHYNLAWTFEQIVSAINDLLSQLRYIDSQWFNNESHYKTAFVIKFSRLYLLGYSYKEAVKGTGEPVFFEDFNTVFRNPILKNRFAGTQGLGENFEELASYLEF